jgi:hypothetical protein
MYQFPGFARTGLCIQPAVTPSPCGVTPGCPIRRSPDQSLFDGSPELIAAYHVLRRLSTPRHPPCTLSSLIAWMTGCPATRTTSTSDAIDASCPRNAARDDSRGITGWKPVPQPAPLALKRIEPVFVCVMPLPATSARRLPVADAARIACIRLSKIVRAFAIPGSEGRSSGPPKRESLQTPGAQSV